MCNYGPAQPSSSPDLTLASDSKQVTWIQ